MNQNIITYLSENKEKYSQDALIAELQKSGYSEGDIVEGVAQVFGGVILAPTKTSFWNFKDKKVYTKASEKWADFLFGVFMHVLVVVTSFFSFGSVEYIGLMLIAVYVSWNRRFIFYGIVAAIALIFVGPVILIFNATF